MAQAFNIPLPGITRASLERIESRVVRSFLKHNKINIVIQFSETKTTQDQKQT